MRNREEGRGEEDGGRRGWGGRGPGSRSDGAQGEREREERGGEDRRGGDDRRGGRGGWGGRGWGGDRGEGGRGGFGGFDPSFFIRRMDANGDGKIEPGEVSDRGRGFLERIAERGGLSLDKTLTVDELVKAASGETSNSTQKSEEGAVPGFGSDSEPPAKVPGFDTPLTPEELGQPTYTITVREQTEDFASGASSTSTSPPSHRNGTSDGKVSNKKEDTIRQRSTEQFKDWDKNTDGFLTPDEWEKVSEADSNSDGKVTLDELIVRNGGSATSSGSAGRTGSNGSRHTYRFTSAIDRVPDTARSWISSRDKNGDGQVSMHEFSTIWNDGKVSEFARYDLNGDGVITGQEYSSR